MRSTTRGLVVFPALLAFAWGVYLIEDGLFNTGSADTREFFIGLVFAITGLLVTLAMQPGWRVLAWFGPRLRIAVMLMFCLGYGLHVYSRWHALEESSVAAGATERVIVHVEASGEWLMVDRALLKRPAHWYETGIDIVYLAGDKGQVAQARLPAKFLSLKSIKEK